VQLFFGVGKCFLIAGKEVPELVALSVMSQDRQPHGGVSTAGAVLSFFARSGGPSSFDLPAQRELGVVIGERQDSGELSEPLSPEGQLLFYVRHGLREDIDGSTSDTF
jgi:hypothetical protein